MSTHTHPSFILFKLLKTKDNEKNIKVSQRNKTQYRGAKWELIRLLIRIHASLKLMEWHLSSDENNRKAVNQNSLHNKIKHEEEIKTFSDKLILREFMASRYGLQEMLNEVIRKEEYDNRQKHGSTQRNEEHYKWNKWR